VADDASGALMPPIFAGTRGARRPRLVEGFRQMKMQLPCGGHIARIEEKRTRPHTRKHGGDIDLMSTATSPGTCARPQHRAPVEAISSFLAGGVVRALTISPACGRVATWKPGRGGEYVYAPSVPTCSRRARGNRHDHVRAPRPSRRGEDRRHGAGVQPPVVSSPRARIHVPPIRRDSERLDVDNALVGESLEEVRPNKGMLTVPQRPAWASKINARR